MKTKFGSRNSPVLLEILLATLIFALAAVVTVPLVVRSYTLSRDTAQRERASAALQDVCERKKASLRAGEEPEAETFWYGREFLPGAEGPDACRIEVAVSPEKMPAGTYYALRLTAFSHSGEPLSGLAGGVYVPEGTP